MSITDGIGSYLGPKNNKNRAVKKDKYSEYSWLVFSDEDYEGYKKASNIKSAFLAGIAVLLSIILFLLMRRAAAEPRLEDLLLREGQSKEIELNLSLEYMGISAQEDIYVTVLPEKLSLSDADILFDECEEWLREILSEGLSFPKEAPNGVEITWQNSDFSYIGIEEPEERAFIAQLAAGEFVRLSEFMVVIDPGEENYKDSLASLAENLADSLSSSETGGSIELPAEDGGAVLSWSVPEKQSPTAIVALGIFAAALIILSRRDTEKKQLEKRRVLFENEVPNLSLQLMLYLNAGLTLEGAFSRLIMQNQENYNPLYRALRDIKSRAEQGNMSFVSEMYSFARKCGSAPFLRLSSLCFEHASRGSELASKLEQERSEMQAERSLNVRTKIKAAETKLCFPLMMLLVSLILITTVPTFLSM